MMIYLDADFKCHIENDGKRTAFETAHFDGKCREFIEGHLCKPDDGLSGGTMIAPWKDCDELDKAQRAYEKQLLTEYEVELTELRENSIPAADLEAAYQEGVDSAYDQ